MSDVERAIATLKTSAPSAEAFETAVNTALKLVQNILGKQDEPKYRRVKVTNAKLDAALFSLRGGRDL